jgi:hypothetical protein
MAYIMPSGFIENISEITGQIYTKKSAYKELRALKILISATYSLLLIGDMVAERFFLFYSSVDDSSLSSIHKKKEYEHFLSSFLLVKYFSIPLYDIN